LRVHVPLRVRRIVLARDKACAYCGLPVVTVIRGEGPYSKRWRAYDDQGNTFHFEHKIPSIAGGLNDETNVVLACRDCNLDKARKEHSKRAYEGRGGVSKQIRVEDHVATDLDKLRVGRQTYSDVIEDLLAGRLKILEAMNMLEGVIKFREWQRQQLETILKS